MSAQGGNALFLCIPTDCDTETLPIIAENSGLAKTNRILIRTDDGPDILDFVNVRFPQTGEINIQSWWNLGIDYCLNNGGRYLAILSDDIYLQKFQLQIMLEELLNKKVVMVHSKNSNGFFWGHAFILDLYSGIRADERFRWAWGDFDLKKRAHKLGGVSVSSQQVEHLRPNVRTNRDPSLQALAKNDQIKFFLKYPMSFIGYMAEKNGIMRALWKKISAVKWRA